MSITVYTPPNNIRISRLYRKHHSIRSNHYTKAYRNHPKRWKLISQKSVNQLSYGIKYKICSAYSARDACRQGSALYHYSSYKGEAPPCYIRRTINQKAEQKQTSRGRKLCLFLYFMIIVIQAQTLPYKADNIYPYEL